MSGEHVVVTGYPSLQARELCQLVLREEPDTTVSAIVLPKLHAQAEAVLRDTPGRSRVQLLEGDAAALDFGLSGAEFRALAAAATRIHHVAHVSYVGVSRQDAEYANVQGAVEAVELARACERLRCLIHHSTAHVSGDRTGTVYEDELDRGQGFHNVVQETRMKAELVMRRAMGEVPIAVIRPTMLAGDSGTGQTDRFDGPYLLVMLVLGLPGDMAVPLPTGGDNPLDIVPIDYVVKAAHTIGRDPSAPGTTFHLSSSENLTAAHVFDLVAEAGGRRVAKSFIPSQVLSALLRTPGVERLLKQPRELWQQLGTGARYDMRNARRVLDPAGVKCPPLASYVDTWITAVQDHLRGRRNPVWV